MYSLEEAQPEMLEACYRIIDDARSFQRSQGFTQWDDSYPTPGTIADDIRRKKGYVLKAGGAIAGYMFIDFDGEPAYRDIEGAWRTQEPYAVAHRIAFSGEFRGKGLSDRAFLLLEELCRKHNIRGIRIDTDPANMRMRHILRKNGFEFCGTIAFQGGGKLAFDKLL